MAVYTKVSADDAMLALGAYDIGTLRGLAAIEQGIENSNYALATTTGAYILTLYEKRVQESDLPFFVDLMAGLARQGITCPVPVAARDGKVLFHLNGRPAAILTALTGRELEPAQVTPEACAEVGRGLARLHQVGQKLQLARPNSMGMTAWPDLFARCAQQADDVQPGLAALLQDEMAWLRQHWPTALPQGLIHADLFRDNVFFAGGKLCGIIDFYFACTDFLAYDVAITLNAWCFGHEAAMNGAKASALLQSYAEIRPLTAAERQALPVLARGACMRFLLSRLYDWLYRVPGALVKPKDPLEYLARLQFHQRAGADIYGFGA